MSETLVTKDDGHDCGIDGHEFEMLTTWDGEIVRIICERCQSQWKVERV